MKNKYILSSILIAGLGILTMSCQKWTEVKVKDPIKLVGSIKSEDYYKKLREYKKTDHPVAFGWFGNWTGQGSSLQGSLAGLPDSTDFVSIWGPWYSPTESMLKDLRYVQQVKGTKALMCDLIFDIGGKITPAKTDEELNAMGKTREQYIYDYWGWTDERTEEGLKKRQEATRKYANALCDIMDKYGYDGFDIDAEPSYAQPFQTKKQLWELSLPENQRTLMTIFVETIGKRVGPMAETAKGREKLFVIDGEPYAIKPELGKYFNYFIFQAYWDGIFPSPYRINSLVDHYRDVMSVEEICKKAIFTADFESGASTGGARLGQLLGFALYKPVIDGKEYQKGGVGSYHMEYEYDATIPAEDGKLTLRINRKRTEVVDVKSVQGATYPWLRKSIQIMNPAK